MDPIKETLTALNIKIYVHVGVYDGDFSISS